MKEKELTFEDRLGRVRGMIDEIEGGKLPLEAAVTRYEDGMKVLSALEAELNEMKRKITVIREGADGSLTEEPFNPDGGN